MKKSIITLVVGFACILTPQVGIAQEQDQLMEMAKTLYQQPSKELMEKTYQFMKSNANTSDKQKKVEELGAYVIYIDETYKLIDIGNQKGKLEDEEKLSNAKKIFEDIDKYIKDNKLSEFQRLYYFNRDKNEIEKALQKKKLIRQFVPYMEDYSKIVIQYFAAIVFNGIEEQKTTAKNKENIKKYYSAIDRMNGKGGIAVAKAKRDYIGDMPFREYYKLKLDGGREKSIALISSFLDEKFVFDKELRQEKLTQLEQSEGKSLSERPKGFTSGIEDLEDFKSMQPTDTFGLCIDIWKPESGFRDKQPLFINLRTGKQYLLHEYDLNNMLESITYLAKSPSIPDFQYDPSYSLTELFKYEWYYPDSPEKMCKALEGLEVYRTDINDYDVITSVNVRRSDDWNGGPAHLIYDVKYQKGGYDKNRWEYDVFSVKWYEQLKKCIGMKVIFCENGEERILYQDFLSNIPYWTLESVELGNLDGRAALVATIKQGQKTERLDAVYNGLFLTRNNLDIFSKDRNMYSHRLLPYDYVKKHAVKAPESVKSELSWFAKTYQESMMQSFREIWVGLNVSLFLAEFPKAKLVKNTVSGGKAIRIYHVNGNEFVFKDGVCTSVTKI
jgi:hypothetical protein